MRALLIASVLSVSLIGSAFAAEFPGPMVKNEAPFNSPNVMRGGALSCPTVYSRNQLLLDKKTIVADVKKCAKKYFGIAKDIGLNFGSGASSYAECVVPETYDVKLPAGNPVWPVCCAYEINPGQYKMQCRIFFTGK